MSREIKDWVTVNHKHIPIYEGESKQDVVHRVIAKDNENKKQKDIERNQKEANRVGHKTKLNKSVNDSMYGVHLEHSDGYWEDTSYIEPGTKEWHEGYDAYVPNYDEQQQLDLFHRGVKASKEQLQALKDYAAGTYHSKSASKDTFVDKYDFSGIIENSKDLHLGGATLFRGADLTDQEYSDLVNGKSNPYLSGVTSWSLREDVAHMYAEGDNISGTTYRTLHNKGGKSNRVIFVEQDTDDAMAFPYATAHNEALRSKNREYVVTKIVPESQYSKIKDIYSSKHSGFDKPVTYVYVKSKKKG